MLFGASRAQSIIMTHPNHTHLLKVLQETKSEIMAGRGPGSPSSSSSDNPFPETQSSSPSWPSEKQDTYPSTANSKDGFDDDTLLSDDEINRQNQGGTYFRFPIYCFSISSYPDLIHTHLSFCLVSILLRLPSYLYPISSSVVYVYFGRQPDDSYIPYTTRRTPQATHRKTNISLGQPPRSSPTTTTPTTPTIQRKGRLGRRQVIRYPLIKEMSGECK